MATSTRTRNRKLLPQQDVEKITIWLEKQVRFRALLLKRNSIQYKRAWVQKYDSNPSISHAIFHLIGYLYGNEKVIHEKSNIYRRIIRQVYKSLKTLQDEGRLIEQDLLIEDSNSEETYIEDDKVNQRIKRHQYKEELYRIHEKEIKTALRHRRHLQAYEYGFHVNIVTLHKYELLAKKVVDQGRWIRKKNNEKLIQFLPNPRSGDDFTRLNTISIPLLLEKVYIIAAAACLPPTNAIPTAQGYTQEINPHLPYAEQGHTLDYIAKRLSSDQIQKAATKTLYLTNGEPQIKRQKFTAVNTSQFYELLSALDLYTCEDIILNESISYRGVNINSPLSIKNYYFSKENFSRSIEFRSTHSTKLPIKLTQNVFQDRFLDGRDVGYTISSGGCISPLTLAGITLGTLYWVIEGVQAVYIYPGTIRNLYVYKELIEGRKTRDPLIDETLLEDLMVFYLRQGDVLILPPGTLYSSVSLENVGVVQIPWIPINTVRPSIELQIDRTLKTFKGVFLPFFTNSYINVEIGTRERFIKTYSTLPLDRNTITDNDDYIQQLKTLTSIPPITTRSSISRLNIARR